MGDFTVQDLARTVRAFATMSHLDVQQIRTAGTGEIDVQYHANSAYGAALGDRGHWMGTLFCAMASIADVSAGDFSAQGIANTA